MKVLVISDVHGNADALKTVLDAAPRHDYVWVLGDLVDYGPEPHVVVDIVKSLKPDAIVMGNHDYAVAFNTDCRCAQELHDLSVYTRMSISYKLLSREQIEWLKMLRHRARLELFSKRIYVVHGAPRNPLYGYLKPELPIEVLEEMLTESSFALKPRPIDVDYVLVGHTHIPTKLRVKEIQVLNPGSIGQPRDGDPRASYAILDLDTESFAIHRVEYPIDRVIEKLRTLNLEQKMLQKLEAVLKNGRVV